MQSSVTIDDTENINPNGFPYSKIIENTTITTTAPTQSTAIESSTVLETSQSKRTQNFSFASNYQPSTGVVIHSVPFQQQQQQQQQQKQHQQLFSSLDNTTKLNYAVPLSSFTVLNTDDLQSAYPLSSSGGNNKPNAVVRPIRRYEEALTLSRSGQHQNNDTDSSESQSQPYNFQSTNPTVTQRLHQQQQQQQQQQVETNLSSLNERNNNQVHNFVEELDRKLRYLHNHRDGQATWADYRRITTQDVGTRVKGKDSFLNTSGGHIQRPLFYTTVPTGIFLPPPKEIPLPAFLRPYVYSSHPMVLNHNGGGGGGGLNNTYGGVGYYNNSSNSKSPTFSKDKLRSNTAPISATDKSYVATSTTATATSVSSRFGGGAGGMGTQGGNNIKSQYSQQLASGVHLTKQQFQQQVQQSRAKREATAEPYKNVMHDRRVVRGSNFAKKKVMSDYESDERHEALHSQQQLFRKKNLARYALRRHQKSEAPRVSQRDELIQTDSEFEEFTLPHILPNTRPTDSPRKVDASTEIRENELFMAYNAESQKLIDLFVDICVEECVLEIEHEIEMDAIRKKRKELEAQREKEAMELKRLEREKIISVYTNSATPKGTTTTAAKLLQGHIANLVPEVLENLEPVVEPAKKEELMKTICPWLTVEVAEEVGQIVDSREILTVIIEEIIRQRAEVYGGYKLEIEAEEIKPPPVDADATEKAAEEKKS